MRKSRGRGPTLAKDINRKLVYHQIKQERDTSRVEVAKQLHLNKNTVNSIVDELIAAGFVHELGQQPTHTAGRKPIRIGFHAENKWAAGVQLTSTDIHWAVTDLYANPLDSFSVPLRAAAPDTVVAALAEGVQRLSAKYPPAHCVGLCLGIPGLMEASSGTVIRSSHLGWEDVPLLAMLKKRINNIHLQLDNSVKLASLGEMWHGFGQGVQNFVYCYFGNGVGCGFIVNGAVVRGEANAAGELGHLVMDPRGPLCRCGNTGCLEAYVSLPSFLQRMSRSLGKSVKTASFEWVLSELESGNKAVAFEFDQAGRRIGQALSYVVNLLNPKLIICDGPLMRASRHLFPVIEEELKRRCLPTAAEQATLVRSKLVPWASCIGAAARAIQAWEEGMDSFEPVIE